MDYPLIGITTYGEDEAGKFPLPREYVDSIRRSGGLPVLLTPGENNIESLMQRINGLILVGGGDIDPNHYGGNMHETIYMIDSERDQTELDLARKAISRGMPILAICRGMQIVNVLCGGTLFEHLPDVVGDDVKHRIAPPSHDQLATPTEHLIQVNPHSRLSTLLPSTEFVAASWHHQAVRSVGNGLTVAAHALDGIIEGLEMPEHPWLFAVQWHPELTAATDSVQQSIFDQLVVASRTQKNH